ncbi:WD40 repeat-like protein [Trematosphaeria pertusa]|uniref:WD40 repeat-like protein n=1 Tax=Trematosphaeria pertusa TaxID=390896 RepID=A0A6A6II84_9PLEO|nr:WD40 repeat-like protein [Trematosphaeria pertusa]KAF2250121.1 WD40 repeat-like protein [Trematosphaeria pertusa]
MPCYTREDFLREYKFPLQPVHDFEVLGSPAEYASGHPKEWGQENESFDFADVIKGTAETAYSSYGSAISPDKKLLAISSKNERVLIYDVNTKELRQVLEGTGTIFFRPRPNRKQNARKDEDETADENEGPVYTLICNVPTENRRRQSSVLVFWDLDQHGRLLDEEEPIDPAALAKQAIDAILPDLETKHEWSRDFVTASTLHADFEKALGKAAADHRRRHNIILEKASLGGFGSTPFSSDGNLMLHRSEGESRKQQKVTVYDIDAGREVYNLFGHTDSIMWMSFSPDDQHIATIAWDGTMRMYSAATGELSWVENAGGQCWSGAFSPDSKHIIWSSKNGNSISVHAVEDGRLISKFSGTLQNWCRCFAWHPDGKEVAFCASMSAWVWRPFEGPEGTIAQHLDLSKDNNWSMASIRSVSWLEHGRLLCVQIEEGTTLIYDTITNAKELFKRPDGVVASWVDGSFYGVFEKEGEKDFYINVDGDGKVRYWRTSVAAYPSWWEKEKEKEESQPKKVFPETRKYVKVTKPVKQEEAPKDGGRDDWADKGARLWTAE